VRSLASWMGGPSWSWGERGECRKVRQGAGHLSSSQSPYLHTIMTASSSPCLSSKGEPRSKDSLLTSLLSYNPGPAYPLCSPLRCGLGGTLPVEPGGSGNRLSTFAGNGGGISCQLPILTSELPLILSSCGTELFEKPDRPDKPDTLL
jgi:hypothetical protein